jgi:chromosome segregation ATPase
MTDRLEGIRERWLRIFGGPKQHHVDINWLISQVDELRQLTQDYAAKIQDQAIRLDECRIMYEDAHERFKRVVKERDKALTDFADMQLRHAALDLSLSAVETERDEARAEVDRLVKAMLRRCAKEGTFPNVKAEEAGDGEGDGR